MFGVAVLLSLASLPSAGRARASPTPAGSPGATRWLDEQSFTASSLETGRIGLLSAWSLDTLGYRCLYRLSGQPPALSVDTETGALTLTTPLAAGLYDFRVLVGDRMAGGSTTEFPVRLTVRPGVTANRHGDQILHATYRVDDTARFGAPVGRDYTNVLLAISRAMQADERREGSGNLRATVLFRRGQLYQYANNRWAWGVQYLQ